MDTATVGVGYLAIIEWGGRTLAGVVEQVHACPHLGETVVQVYAVGPGVVCVGLEQIRPAGVPRPEPGQRWVCVEAGVALTVLEVERGGLVATCRTDKGNVGRFVLVGHYQPES